MRYELGRLGWSLSKFAGKLGKDPATVSRWKVLPLYAENYLRCVLAHFERWEGLDEG